MRMMRAHSVRLAANEMLPVQPGGFIPYAIYTQGPVREVVEVNICGRTFMWLEPETFIPVLARLTYKVDEAGEHPDFQPIHLGLKDLQLDVLRALPHRRSLEVTPQARWSFAIGKADVFFLRTRTPEERDFVLVGAIEAGVEAARHG